MSTLLAPESIPILEDAFERAMAAITNATTWETGASAGDAEEYEGEMEQQEAAEAPPPKAARTRARLPQPPATPSATIPSRRPLSPKAKAKAATGSVSSSSHQPLPPPPPPTGELGDDLLDAETWQAISDRGLDEQAVLHLKRLAAQSMHELKKVMRKLENKPDIRRPSNFIGVAAKNALEALKNRVER